MQLIECVPNFSEGRDEQVITAIAEAAQSVRGVDLLHVDSNVDANRTVMTMIGGPEAIAEGAFRAIKRAGELIDMSNHQGAHPRIGATDICPFVPLAGASIAECAQLARSTGARVAEELDIPVYLYGDAAGKKERIAISAIRKGEYERLQSRLTDPKFTPDYGPSVLNTKSGATIIGARSILIAHNVCLGSENVIAAKQIPADIREGGSKSSLPGIRAIGWQMESYACAQVSMNIVDYKSAAPHVAMDRIIELAAELGEDVTGSELIGMIPLEGILMAGRHYMSLDRAKAANIEEIIAAGMKGLGIEAVKPFQPTSQIIELAVKNLGGDVGKWAEHRIEKLKAEYLS